MTTPGEQITEALGAMDLAVDQLDHALSILDRLHEPHAAELHQLRDQLAERLGSMEVQYDDMPDNDPDRDYQTWFNL